MVDCKVEWFSWWLMDNMIWWDFGKYVWYVKGVLGGKNNLFGVCVLYFYKNGWDIMYCIYGMIQLNLIGWLVFNGCICMINDYVIDFYECVFLGIKVVVFQWVIWIYYMI